MLAGPVNHGAVSARLMLKMPNALPRYHVPVALFADGSDPTGQPSGPPGWLHDIPARSPTFCAAVENCSDAAASVVLLIRWACARARITWLVMKRPCSATSA